MQSVENLSVLDLKVGLENEARQHVEDGNANEKKKACTCKHTKRDEFIRKY